MRSPYKLKAPKRGRPPGGFTQHNRLVAMQTVLENHPEGLPLADLAGALRVSKRSVRRYLRELAKSTKLEPVETRPGGAFAWRIKPTERGRAVMLRRTQAYGLLAVRRVFDVMRGSALYDELDVVQRQLLQLAHRPTHLGASDVASDTRLETRLVYSPDVARSYTQKGAELDDLFRAVADLRVVSFRDGQTRIRLHPYALILYQGAIYVVGRDTRTGDVEPYLLDRVQDTEVSDSERFVLPNDFDAEEFIHGAFGVSPPAPRVRVLIEFDPTVAERVRAQRVHPSQRIATSPDGRVRLSLQVPLFDSLKAWVLGFGAAARVIEPRELRDAVVESLRGALDAYR
jgi:predicted DNA-binding transcriptional regulator YafY